MRNTKFALLSKIVSHNLFSHHRSKRLISLALASVAGFRSALAQTNALDNKVNDALRGSDKLYVVVAVLVTIFTVLLAYLVYQDIKLNRLQKDLNSKTKHHE